MQRNGNIDQSPAADPGGVHVVSAEREAITGVRGQSAQRGPGTEPWSGARGPRGVQGQSPGQGTEGEAKAESFFAFAQHEELANLS